MRQRLRDFPVLRYSGGVREAREDRVAVEEPLEMRLNGDTWAITMRTPGHDRELVLGLLLGEGIISGSHDVLSLAHCTRLDDAARGNVMDVSLASHVRLPDRDPAFARRGTLTTSACGVCGRRTVEDLLARCGALPPGPTVSAPMLSAAMGAMRERQSLFEATGGVHAASLVTGAGHPLATFEDVGRHNAVDKVIGSRLVSGGLPASEGVLLVSGRASFEIVQKAISARIPVVAAVSAPSSLAVDLARGASLTLVGFTRGESLTIYSAAERLL